MHLVSQTVGFDFSTPAGKLIYRIMASGSEMERDLIRERTLAGLKAAPESGVLHGRPQTVTPERVEKAREMVSAGARPGQLLPVLQGMAGPKIGRSRVHQWVKDFKSLSLDNQAA